MKKVMFLIGLTIIMLSSCSHDSETPLAFLAGAPNLEEVDETNLTLRDEFNWRKENESISLSLPESKRVIGFNKNYKGIYVRDIITGNVQWNWKDYFSEQNFSPDVPSFKNTYINDDLMIFNKSTRYYCLNLNTGETVWKKELPSEECATNFQKMTGAKDFYFQVRNIILHDDLVQDALFVGDIKNPTPMKMVLAPDFQTDISKYNIGIGKIGDILAFEKNGEILLAITYSEPTETHQLNTYVGVWNFTQKKWNYKDVLVMDNAATGKLEISNDKLICYNAAELNSYNLENGELEYHIPNQGTSIEFSFSDEYILVTDGIEIQLRDLETGNIQWTRTNAYMTGPYLSSRFIYFFESGYLKIADLNNGKILESIANPYTNHPEENDYSSGYYFSGMTVIEDKENKVDYLILMGSKYAFGMEYGK